MRLLKTIAVFFGVLLALAGVASVISAGFVFGVYRSHSAASGFFSTPVQTIGSRGFALTAPDINGQPGSEWERWALARAGATLRVTGSSKLPVPVFIGVAATDRVSQYLSGVPRDRITSIDLAGGSVAYEHVDGKTLPASPQKQRFWEAKAAGTGSQTLQWSLREGDWTVVIMNADGSAPVAADVRLAARFDVLYPLIAGLAGLGVLLLGIGATLIVLGGRRYS